MNTILSLRKGAFISLFLLPALLMAGVNICTENDNPKEKKQSKFEYINGNYSFVRHDLNVWEDFGNKHALNSFFDKLYTLEKENKGKVNILHIGDSHIQADFLTGHLRELFYMDKRFPMSARGFVFPYRMAKSNNPSNYQVKYTGSWTGKRISVRKHHSDWGIAGYTTNTLTNGAKFRISPNADSVCVFETNEIKVFDLGGEKSYEVVFNTEDLKTEILRTKENTYTQFNATSPLDEIRLHIKKTAPTQKQFLLQGIFLDNQKAGITYSSAGANSASVNSFLKNEKLGEQIQALHPDLLVISLGTNDAYNTVFNEITFKEEYRKLLKSILVHQPHLEILLTTPGDNYRMRKYVNMDNVKARKVIMELAQEFGFVVWDMYAVMGGLKAIDAWYQEGLSSEDRIHLNRKGYMYQAELFYDAFDKAYKEFTATKMAQEPLNNTLSANTKNRKKF